MKITFVSLAIFVILISLSINITDEQKIEYAVDFCSEKENFCISSEDGKIYSKMNLNVNKVNSFTLKHDGEKIECSVTSGRINFDEACNKAYLVNLIRTGKVNGVNLLVPELGLSSVSLEPVLSFVLRYTILAAEASLLLFFDFLSFIVTIVLGFFKI